MATASKAVKKVPDPPKVKSIAVVTRCRFRPLKEPEYKNTKMYEWMVTVGIKNPGDPNPPDETKTMPFIQFVILHPHPDFGLGPQVKSEAPYAFGAQGYKAHPMLIEIHFKEHHSPITMTFNVRFEGDDVKRENKTWWYYEDEQNKIFSDFSDKYYNMLIQSGLVQTPKTTPSPPDITAPSSLSSASAGGAPINSKHPAMRRNAAKKDASKRSSLSKEIVYEQEEESDNNSENSADTAASISSSASDSSKTSTPTQPTSNRKGDIAKKTITSTPVAASPNLNKKKCRNAVKTDISEFPAGETPAPVRSKLKPSATPTTGQHGKNGTKDKLNGSASSSRTKNGLSTSANNHHKADNTTVPSSVSASKTPSMSSTTINTAKRKRSLENDLTASNGSLSVKEGDGAKRARSAPPSTTSKKLSLEDNSSMDVDAVQDNRFFKDEKDKAFTLDDVLDRIERINLEGKPVVEVMCIVKRAKDAHEGVDFTFEGSFDFDLDTLPDTAVMELWSLLNRIDPSLLPSPPDTIATKGTVRTEALAI
ncbi:hypothetical protein SeMB42_g01508 [Synchytrium endobioticum]|uniref:YEATS domain-containing protein n=1 Tax=Synchytrium endobioticum TaxID=286115 RepID=A0A507DKY5_9FUNG|nr:hypothetical protein SeLEV6574_g01983 [Synchytrium endobioticum]TPX52314.1 hypothetical protein SeMB42_g01508 [Synchytrium endobioticum]